jgi:hypothetical protein
MKTLDITSFLESGKELANKVEHEFKSTQSFIIQPYPYEILMTRHQFDDLTKTTGNIEDMYGEEKDRMWVTKDGYVMEVKVKDE